MVSNSDKYPIVLIPDGIMSAFHYVPSDDEIERKLSVKKPILPKPPIFPNLPSKKVKIRKIKTRIVSEIGCAWILCLPMAYVVVYGLANSLYYGELRVFIFFLVILLFFTFSFFRLEKINYEILRNLTEKEYEKLEIKYLNELAEYYENERKFKSDVINYKDEILTYNNFLKNERSNIELEIYRKNIAPVGPLFRSDEIYKRGRVELYFLEGLIDWFGDRIKVDYKPSNYDGSYLPDFTYVCPTTNLHVDIEIDEPYTLKDNKPIHFVDSEDGNRDAFFLSLNWVVVRFAESQIINNREECCMQIDEVVDSIVNKEIHFQVFIEPQKRWTYEEALVMAKNKQRQRDLEKIADFI